MGRYLSVWNSYRDFPYSRAAPGLPAEAQPRLGLGDAHAVESGARVTMCDLSLAVPVDAPVWPPAGGPRCLICNGGTGFQERAAGQVIDQLGRKIYDMMDPARASTPDSAPGGVPDSQPSVGDAAQPVHDRRGPRRPWGRRRTPPVD